ncbi:hypothetical protein [Daejeonella oryzae]|uniref:hypothetical protein n=1 Tax=Daejeonella oryzae TaxID=1122943 RepID=UPI00041E0AE6|nr:hypothetical protein [Daejeonella oryzae]
MELEQMKSGWAELTNRVEKQELLSNQMIERISKQKYHSKLNKIGFSEYTGTIVCYIAAAYISVNLLKIDQTLMQVFGLVSIALLLILPIISLQSLRAVKGINISSKTYLETIKSFAAQKIRFQKLQKLNVALGMLLMLIIIPVFSAIQGKNLSQIPNFWTIIFPVSVLFFLGFAFWVLKYYNKVLSEAEQMLSDINN